MQGQHHNHHHQEHNHHHQGHRHGFNGMAMASPMHHQHHHNRVHSVEEQDYVSSVYENSHVTKVDIEAPIKVGFKTSGSIFKEPTIYKKGVAELLSTFILVFAGCGAIMVEARDKVLTHIGVAAVFGLTVMAMLYAVGHISGAQMNPAVSIAFATVRTLPFKELPVYLVAQIMGATLASAALKNTIGYEVSLDVVVNVSGGNYLGSLLFEFIMTFILLLVLSAMATDPKAPGALIGVAVGGTVGFCTLFGGPISGASLNPARSLGPALLTGKYTDLGVYIAGPILGGICGAWAYRGIRLYD